MLKKIVRGVKILISRARGHKGFLDEDYDEIAEQIRQLESTRNCVNILDKESKKYYQEAEKKQKFLEKTQWHNQKELI